MRWTTVKNGAIESSMRNICLLLALFFLLATPATAWENYGTLTVSRVVSVYDGDTFRVDIDGLPPLIGQDMPVRIAGIDCPEMRGKDTDKAAAITARDALRDLLENADLIELRNVRRGKYFRIVADVFVDGVDFKTLTVCDDYK